MKLNRTPSTKDCLCGTSTKPFREVIHKVFKNEASLELLRDNLVVSEHKLRFLETLFVTKKSCKPSFIYYVNKSGNLVSRDMSQAPTDKVLRLFCARSFDNLATENYACAVFKETARDFYTPGQLKTFLSQKNFGVKAIQTYRKSLFGSDVLIRAKLRRVQNTDYEISLEKTVVTEPPHSEPVMEGTLRVEKEIVETAFGLLKAFKWKLREEAKSMSVLFLIDRKEKVWVSEIERLEVEAKGKDNFVEFLMGLETYTYNFNNEMKKKQSGGRAGCNNKWSEEYMGMLGTGMIRGHRSSVLQIQKKGKDEMNKTFSSFSVSGVKASMYPRSHLLKRPPSKRPVSVQPHSFGRDYYTDSRKSIINKPLNRPQTQGGVVRNTQKSPSQISIMIPSTTTLPFSHHEEKPKPSSYKSTLCWDSESTYHPYNVHSYQTRINRNNARSFSLSLTSILFKTQHRNVRTRKTKLSHN